MRRSVEKGDFLGWNPPYIQPSVDSIEQEEDSDDSGNDSELE